MGDVIDFSKARPKGFSDLSKKDQGYIIGYMQGLFVSAYSFEELYGMLKPLDRAIIDQRIKNILQEERGQNESVSK